MGALDLDQDGFPEVSIAVATTKAIANSSTSFHTHLQRSDVAPAFTIVRPVTLG